MYAQCGKKCEVTGETLLLGGSLFYKKQRTDTNEENKNERKKDI